MFEIITLSVTLSFRPSGSQAFRPCGPSLLADAARAFRRNPANFARLIALLRKRLENTSCDISIISRSFGSTTPSRGSRR